MSNIFTIGYVLSLLVVLGLNLFATKNPNKLLPLPVLLSEWMKSRNTRLALAIIWWWLGWHFLYSPL